MDRKKRLTFYNKILANDFAFILESGVEYTENNILTISQSRFLIDSYTILYVFLTKNS